MNSHQCHEDIQIFRRANPFRSSTSRIWNPSRGGLPQAGNLAGDVLQLEAKVYGNDLVRPSQTQRARTGEPPAQEAGRRPVAGQTYASGGPQKKDLKPAVRRDLVTQIMDEYQVSLRRACALMLLATSCWYYKSKENPVNEVLTARIREIAYTRIRYGFWRIYVVLRREGWFVNHKRVHRLYKLEGLNLRSKRPRRSRAAAHRLDRFDIVRPNQQWSMDFVTDHLLDGRRFRALTVVDNFTRRCLALHAGGSIRGQDVVEIVSRLCEQIGQTPERIQVDNGSEFISKAMDHWAYENKVTLDFSRPGKPTDNPYIESFNGSFRDECLNLHWFLTIDDVREKFEAWREEYNSYRPHSSLGDLTPDEYLEQNLKTVPVL